MVLGNHIRIYNSAIPVVPRWAPQCRVYVSGLIFLVHVLFVFLVSSLSAYAQIPSKTIEELCASGTATYTEPKWIYSNNQLYSLPIGSLTYTASAELSLITDGESQWQDYQQELQEFCQWFEDSENERTNNFDSAQGDAKIEAALKLVELIIEAYYRWDQIVQPLTGEWEGDYQTKIYMPPPFLELSVEQKGRMKLSVTDTSDTKVGLKVQGELKDGEFKSLLRVYSEGAPFLVLEQEGKFEIAVLGVAVGNLASVVIADKILEFESGLNFGGFFVGYSDYVGGVMTTEVYAISDLEAILLGGGQSYHNFHYDNYTFFTRTVFDGELDLSERLNRYFRQYVFTIDDIKWNQYSAQTEPKAQASIALETFNLLMMAEQHGERAGVDLEVIESTGLERRAPNSLYDQWFARWIPKAMQVWDEKVNNAVSESEKSVIMEGRLNFLLEKIYYDFDAIVSTELLESLQLYEGSPLVDQTYQSYFLTTFTLWKTKVQADSSQLSAATAWLDVQIDSVQIFISVGLYTQLGLNTPEVLRQELQSAAGVTP